MEKRESWGGTIGFVLATAGSAIGLGNIWKFPYITGLNGGGAFVLVYLGCICLLGLPLMMSEMMIGRRTGKNPFGAFRELSVRRSRLADVIGIFLLAQAVCMALSGSPGFGILSAAAGGLILWKGFAMIGAMVIAGGLAILTYYSVVGAWILEYVWKSFSGQLDYATLAEAKSAFGAFTEEPLRVVFFHLAFLGLCAAMLWGGIRDGIERWSKILMPVLFLLLVAVILRGVTLPGAGDGIRFFLKPDFSKLSARGVLEALGHSFYSLSLAMGIMITYGSYMKKDQNIFRSSLYVIGLDTAAAIMAGLAIFPAVFAMKFNPGSGPSLIFEILPATFNHFPGGFGWFWAGLFFLMLTIAALTSGASLLEIGVTFAMDQLHWKRRPTILLLFLVIGAGGILSAVSISGWNHIEWMRDAIAACFGADRVRASFFDTMDYITSNWCLPLGGLLTALFIGWVWGAKRAARELRRGAGDLLDVNLLLYLSGFRNELFYRPTLNHGLTCMTLWAILIRFAVPAIILCIFLQSIGVNLGF